MASFEHYNLLLCGGTKINKNDLRIAGDFLCGLVIRVPGYRSSGPGFDSRSYQIF
jgi:hypothetical protein